MLDFNPRSLTAGTIDVLALIALLASLYCRLERQRATGRAILPRTAPWSGRPGATHGDSLPSPSEAGAPSAPFQSPSLFPQQKYSDDDGGEVKEKKRKPKEILQRCFRIWIQAIHQGRYFFVSISKHVGTVVSNIRATTAIAIHPVVTGHSSPEEEPVDLQAGSPFSLLPQDWRLLFAPRTVTEWLADALCVWGNYLTFTVRNTFVLFSVLIALTDALSVGIASPRLSRKALSLALFVTLTGILGHWLNTALVLGLLSSWLSCILYGSLLCYDLAWPPAQNFSAGAAPTASIVSEKTFSIVAQGLYLWNLFADCRAREIVLLPRWWIGTLAVFLQDSWLLYRFHQAQSQKRRIRIGNGGLGGGSGGDLAAGLNFMLPPSVYSNGATSSATYQRYPKETDISFA